MSQTHCDRGDSGIIWHSDESSFHADPFWSLRQGTPEAYSVLATGPLEVQLAPPPEDVISLHALTVDVGEALTPEVSESVLGIPDDYAWGIKYGAMADLLSKDESRDPARAAFCEQRYQQCVAIAKLCPVALQGYINGSPILLSALADLDAADPTWQTSLGTPESIALTGSNLLALAPVPDSVAHSVTLDLVRNAPIPTADSDPVEIGKEHFDAIINYARHLALFKIGGAILESSLPAAEALFQAAANFNLRLRAQSFFSVEMTSATMREARRGRPYEASTEPHTVARGRRAE